MVERIRLGNVYEHSRWGLVMPFYRSHENIVWAKDVVARDNAGVINTGVENRQQPYKKFLASVTMEDYPENWDRKARAVKERDDYTCQGCGASKEASHTEQNASSGGCGDEDANELHAHHIVPLGAGGSNARSNLITLCDECHGRVHGGVT